MSINFRRGICRLLHAGFLYKLFDCKRYAPPAPPPTPPTPPPPPPIEPPKPKPYKERLVVFAPDIITGAGDVNAFAKSCADNGADYVRMFMLYTQPWRGTNPLQPWKMYRTWRAGYDDAPDLPFFDLTDENVAYWERVRQIWAAFKANNVGAIITLETCPPGGWPKYYHPFLSSKQKRNPDNPGQDSYLSDGLWGDYRKPENQTLCYMHRTFAERVVAEAKFAGIDFQIETGNELWWATTPPGPTDWSPEYAVGWHQWFVNAIISAGVPKERIHVSLIQENVKKAISEQVGNYWYHGAVRQNDIGWQAWIDPSRLWWSGDGGFGGNGDADAKGRKGLSAEDAPAVAANVRQYGYPGYEYMSRKLWLKNNDSLDLSDFNPAPARAIAEAWGWRA